jgi:hypothetical protein
VEEELWGKTSFSLVWSCGVEKLPSGQPNVLWPATSVDKEMLLHVARLGEALPTVDTLKWFLSGVDSLMHLQLVAVGEALGAVAAAVRFLTRMDPHMTPQVRRLVEKLSAEAAPELPLGGVRHQLLWLLFYDFQ